MGRYQQSARADLRARVSRNGRDCDALAEAMCRHYRVLCPDFVGRGKSDWLRNKVGYGYPQYLSDMSVLIARTGAAQVDWVGTSMGGLTGMFIAAQPKSPIRKMVINDVGPHIPMAALERIGTYVGTKSVFDLYETYKEHLKIIAAPFGLKTEAQWDQIARSSVRIGADGKAHSNCDPAIGGSFRSTAAADIDLSPFWNTVRCPVLVTRGALSDLCRRKPIPPCCKSRGRPVPRYPEWVTHRCSWMMSRSA